MKVKKADGSLEDFSEQKVITSIKRAGIPESLQAETLMHVKSKIYEGIPTSEIYHHIVEFLTDFHHPYNIKYSLKQSLMDLGPTGYPFEDYIAKLLEQLGYSCKTRTLVQGKCITHEIDVIASKDKEKIMVEAKFHNTTGVKTDIHVGLYTYARFEDSKDKNGFTKPMLITNTKVTSEVIAYAQCVGMDVLSWSYPERNGLRELLEQFQLFPITAVNSLSLQQKQTLLQNNVILCSDLCANEDVLSILNLSKDQKNKVLQESSFVCNLMKIK